MMMLVMKTMMVMVLVIVMTGDGLTIIYNNICSDYDFDVDGNGSKATMVEGEMTAVLNLEQFEATVAS